MRLFLLLIFTFTSPLAWCATTDADHSTEQTQKEKDEDARYRSTLLFSNVLELIRDEYVDTNKIDYDRLTYAALKGMVSSLDPHSQFLDPQSYTDMRSDTQGQFGGLGVSVGISEGWLTINVPIEGAPGFKAGLLPNDRIIKIDDKVTKPISLNDAVRLLRGDPGTSVKLLIYRPSVKQFKEFNIVREVIRVPTVRDADILPPSLAQVSGIAYIRITQFGDNTREEFESAIHDLQAKGMRGLIIDLRNNPGGLLEAAVDVAGKFLPTGSSVVSTEGRLGASERVVYNARDRMPILDLPIIVLINGNSASGAEIVAGALKDTHRAILIGETTFGKGSVQTVQAVDRTVNPPAALRLTTAHYYTPAHRLIHEHGVEPDIVANVSEDEERALFLRRSNALLNPEEKDLIANVQDSQLQRAIAVMHGIFLYNARLKEPEKQLQAFRNDPWPEN
jgi:carboxyl-terminal processing protease